MSNVDDKSDQVTNVLEASGAPKLTSAPWSPEDGKLLGTMPDSEVARLLNRAPSAIRHRRQKLRIPAYQSAFHLWTPEEEQLLGTMPELSSAGRSCTYPCHGPGISLGRPPKTSCWAP
jgi:hypothetical protein